MVGLRKVIIAGGRDFDDYQFLLDSICPILKSDDDIEIVSGCAKGADMLGERFANYFGLPIKKFPADWDRYGRGAGHIRNSQMAKYADELIAFWDKKSKGTKHMINTAKKLGLKINVFVY